MSQERVVTVAGVEWRLTWDGKGYEISKRKGSEWDEPLVVGAGTLDLQWMLKKWDEMAPLVKARGYRPPVPREVYVALMGN